jgi:cytoskeletal protein CcmA (bactofilin family)
MTSTYCPKCRTTLDLAGYTIDAASSETLKTLGTIRITRRGSISGAHLLATTIDLSGRIKDSLAQAFDALIIRPGADFVRKEVVSSDLSVDAGAEVKLNEESAYRHVEVSGQLQTKLFATGVVTIRAGATFTGAITAGHLVVEDGATVRADLEIGAEGLEKAKKRYSDLRENPPLSWAAERIVVPVLPELETSGGEAAS